MCFLEVYAYGQNAIVYVGPIVWEKEKKIKYAIRSMGGTLHAYWFANLTVDFLVFCLLQVVFMTYIYFFNIDIILDNSVSFVFA